MIGWHYGRINTSGAVSIHAKSSTQIIRCSRTSAAVGKTPVCKSIRSSGRITASRK